MRKPARLVEEPAYLVEKPADLIDFPLVGDQAKNELVVWVSVAFAEKTIKIGLTASRDYVVLTLPACNYHSRGQV